tara:strand:+ start:9208 stop:9321 length:114 start_codon:yes stop_codon:yes gene_type:complete
MRLEGKENTISSITANNASNKNIWDLNFSDKSYKLTW